MACFVLRGTCSFIREGFQEEAKESTKIHT